MRGSGRRDAMEGWDRERPALVGGAARGLLAGAALLLAAATASPAVAQDPEEAVMVAAAEWVLERVPGGEVRVDPHRSGAGKDRARVERVARTLGARLGTLDELRECTDVMDPSTCTLGVDRLLAIASPRIDDDEARVKVYAWYRADSPSEPVAQRSWELRLTREGPVWRVVAGR